MYFNNNEIELTDEVLIEIVQVAKETFCNGIYVPCDEHPCGWDFISFDYIEDYEEILEYEFEDSDISDNIYCNHPYDGKTLKEILTETKCQFNFEK